VQRCGTQNSAAVCPVAPALMPRDVLRRRCAFSDFYVQPANIAACPHRLIPAVHITPPAFVATICVKVQLFDAPSAVAVSPMPPCRRPCRRRRCRHYFTLSIYVFPMICFRLSRRLTSHLMPRRARARPAADVSLFEAHAARTALRNDVYDVAPMVPDARLKQMLDMMP